MIVYWVWLLVFFSSLLYHISAITLLLFIFDLTWFDLIQKHYSDVKLFHLIISMKKMWFYITKNVIQTKKLLLIQHSEFGIRNFKSKNISVLGIFINQMRNLLWDFLTKNTSARKTPVNFLLVNFSLEGTIFSV